MNDKFKIPWILMSSRKRRFADMFQIRCCVFIRNRCFPENIAKPLTKDFFYRTHTVTASVISDQYLPENILMITTFSSLKIVNKVFLLTTLFLKSNTKFRKLLNVLSFSWTYFTLFRINRRKIICFYWKYCMILTI